MTRDNAARDRGPLMKLLPIILIIFGLASGIMREGRGAELMPGVTFFDTKERLKGALIFIFSDDPTTNWASQARTSVYEYDLGTKTLRKITPTVRGSLFCAANGKMVAVAYGAEPVSHLRGTNILLFDVETHLSRVLDLGKAPRTIQIVGRHAFFWIAVEGHDKIFDYDFARATKTVIEMPAASRWETEIFESVEPLTDSTNALHFRYSGVGTRLANGKDYKSGYYELNIETRAITWIGNSDPDMHTFRAADGRYIGFEGADGPIEGHKLISSPVDEFRPERMDPKRSLIKLLKNFSGFRTWMGGSYSLEQMSPCRHYALVRLEEPTVATKMGGPGSVNTYFIVNASTGETEVLVKDDVRKKIVGYASEFHWVGPPFR